MNLKYSLEAVLPLCFFRYSGAYSCPPHLLIQEMLSGLICPLSYRYSAQKLEYGENKIVPFLRFMIHVLWCLKARFSVETFILSLIHIHVLVLHPNYNQGLPISLHNKSEEALHYLQLTYDQL